MIVAEQVQEPMREIPVELRADRPPLLPRPASGGVERDYHVAQERPIPRRLGEREREHVGRGVLAAPLPVESADAAVADEQDGDLRVSAPERGEERGGAAAQAAGGGAPARVLRGEADGHGLARSWMAGGGGASSPARGGYAGRV